MNIQNRRSSRGKGQVVNRTVFGLGMIAAGGLAYLLSPVNPIEALILPAIVLGSVAFGTSLFSRARSRQHWSAAWEAYARREVAGASRDAANGDRKLTMANAN